MHMQSDCYCISDQPPINSSLHLEIAAVQEALCEEVATKTAQLATDTVNIICALFMTWEIGEPHVFPFTTANDSR